MKKTLSILSILCSIVAFAQQTPQSNTYIYNPFSINPAYAGASGCTEINFSHLNQWVKVDGAPLTSYLNANALIGKSIGVGGAVMVDKIGMLQQISGSAAASYGLTFSNTHNLRFGLSAGYNQYLVDPDGAIYFDMQDPIVNGGSQSSGAINTELGVLYKWKGLELAFSSQQILQTYSNFGYSGLDGYGLRRHISGLVAYNYSINPDWAIKPSLYMKGLNTGMQLDINADAQYKGFIHAGLGYRTAVGIIGRLGVKIQDLFFIGYAYESPMRNIASYSSGSHQIVLGLRFCKKKEEIIEIAEIKKDSIPEEVTKRMDSVTIEDVVKVPDTVYIQKIDTVFIQAEVQQKNMVSDQVVKETLLNVEKNVLFDFDQSSIQLKSFSHLENLAKVLKLREDIMLEVEGHTDDRASEEYNLKLSKSRSEQVKQFLVDNGISSDRIKTSFYGESKPIATNNTKSGRQMNRRVRIKVISKN